MQTIEKTRLEDGRLVSLISDNSMRQYNVSVFSPNADPEKDYLFPVMVNEVKARRKYGEFIKKDN